MADSFQSTSLRYDAALTDAVTNFRTLLSSATSRSWKALPVSPSYSHSTTSASNKGKAKELVNGIGPVESVVVHKKAVKNGPDVVRAVTELEVGEGIDLDCFAAVLKAPETRAIWDKLVEKAQMVELINPETQIAKTDYRLGWPASPRDTITISKTFSDRTTLINISTSLPRSTDEPSFLRPAPPFVRSQVNLLAWCIQLLPPSPTTTDSPSKLRLTVFYQWSLQCTLQHAQMSQLLYSFVGFVRERGDQIPFVSSSGLHLELASTALDLGQEILKVHYSILPEDDLEKINEPEEKGLEELNKQRERKRLERGLEFSLAANQGWDIKVEVKPVGGEDVVVSWEAQLESNSNRTARLLLRLTHGKVEKLDQLVRVEVSIQRLAGGKIVKINGQAKEVAVIEDRNPSFSSPSMLDDTPSLATSITTHSTGSSSSPTIPAPALLVPISANSEILALLRRNYIYFTSLLQEPEAKWKPVSDSQGVTVTQLNSIDPTLTIYKAEATFVGVGVWDVFSAICTPGARMQWDKYLEDVVLLEDINELSSLWHVKTKGTWLVAPRDAVNVQTSYKSPSSVHVFSFSTDDTSLFPTIPSPVAPTIRCQTDLYGWAIEALSPTTTQLTLLDQSDPKGWSNKTWTPMAMVHAVAGVGAYSVKYGGPPIITRLLGAKKIGEAYEHDKGRLKVEYKAAKTSGTAMVIGEEGGDGDWGDNRPLGGDDEEGKPLQNIECVVRCDCSTWAASIDIVVDPPPSRISCLSRHRLSSGGGLWITIEHDPAVVGTERILVLVRKGSGGREKGSVTVNGAKSVVDVELLPAEELSVLTKRKRVKASPIPLDQYPTYGTRMWKTTPRSSEPPSGTVTPTTASTSDLPLASVDSPLASSSATSPLAQTTPIQNSTLTVSDSAVTPHPTKPTLPAPGYALEALSWLQQFHAEQGPELTDPAPGWAIVSERAGTVVRRKIIPRVSETLPVYRGDKIIQGLTADEIASVVASVGCRKAWDERVESAVPLTSYGHGCSTVVLTTKPTFPFKGRIFHVATVNAQVRVPSASAASSTSTVLFCASASYPRDHSFDNAKTNPFDLLIGHVLLEGWILETLDPYASSMLAIPSTRCTYISCVDHGGSVPLAFNGVLNANLARTINAVEALGKNRGPFPRIWTPDVSLRIEGPLSDEGGQECVWKLGSANQGSVLLSADFSTEDGTFRSLVKIPPRSLQHPEVISTPVAVKKTHVVRHSLSRLESLPTTPPHTTTAITPASTTSSPIGAIPIPPLLSKSSLTMFGSPPSSLMRSSPPGLVHKGSMASLRDKSRQYSRSRSPSRFGRRNGEPEDVVVAEFMVDLTRFPHGYSIACSSTLVPPPVVTPNAPEATGDSADVVVVEAPLSLDPIRSLADRHLPLYATAHSAPLPTILSASLDSWKRSNHLVRILLPTSSQSSSTIIDPLRAPEERKAADWVGALEKSGALVDVRIVPLPKETAVVLKGIGMGQRLREIEGEKRVVFNGEELVIQSQMESRGVLGKMVEDEDWRPEGATISRVPRKIKTKSDENDGGVIRILPPELEKPLAIAVRLLHVPKAKVIKHDSTHLQVDRPGTGNLSLATKHVNKSENDAPKSGGLSSVFRREASLSDASMNVPLLSLLGSYPLSRLSSSLPTSSTFTSTSSSPLQLSPRRTYSLSSVLVVALVAFLLGSLLRSLLSPSDYVLYRPCGAGGPIGVEAQRALWERFLGAEEGRSWKMARRLLQVGLPTGWGKGWDVVVAVVRR